MANRLNYQDKPETKGTEEFCRKFDYFFDCLNGQHGKQGLFDRKPALKPYRSVDDDRITVSENLCNLKFFENH